MGGAVGREAGGGASAATKVAKLQTFDRTSSKVSGFLEACRLYIRMRLREALVEEQINWILSHVQGGSADIWKENVMEELETGEIEFKSVGEFLAEIKKEFWRRRQRISEGSRAEENQTRRKDDRRVCVGL